MIQHSLTAGGFPVRNLSLEEQGIHRRVTSNTINAAIQHIRVFEIITYWTQVFLKFYFSYLAQIIFPCGKSVFGTYDDTQNVKLTTLDQTKGLVQHSAYYKAQSSCFGYMTTYNAFFSSKRLTSGTATISLLVFSYRSAMCKLKPPDSNLLFLWCNYTICWLSKATYCAIKPSTL